MLFDDLPGWTISILAWINISYSKWRKFVVNLLTQLCNRRTTTKGVPWEGKSGSGNGLVLSIQGCSKCMKVFNEDGSVGHTLDRLIWINTGKFIVVAPLHLPFRLLHPFLHGTPLYFNAGFGWNSKQLQFAMLCSSTLSVIFHILSNMSNNLPAKLAFFLFWPTPILPCWGAFDNRNQNRTPENIFVIQNF